MTMTLSRSFYPLCRIACERQSLQRMSVFVFRGKFYTISCARFKNKACFCGAHCLKCSSPSFWCCDSSSRSRRSTLSWAGPSRWRLRAQRRLPALQQLRWADPEASPISCSEDQASLVWHPSFEKIDCPVCWMLLWWLVILNQFHVSDWLDQIQVGWISVRVFVVFAHSAKPNLTGKKRHSRSKQTSWWGVGSRVTPSGRKCWSLGVLFAVVLFCCWNVRHIIQRSPPVLPEISSQVEIRVWRGNSSGSNGTLSCSS